jgi:hypothetical protein
MLAKQAFSHFGQRCGDAAADALTQGRPHGNTGRAGRAPQIFSSHLMDDIVTNFNLKCPMGVGSRSCGAHGIRCTGGARFP